MKGFLAYMGIPFEVKVKVPKTLPNYVETSDIDRIVDWIKSKQSHKSSMYSDLALLHTAKRAGMSRSELAILRVKDLSANQNRLFVRDGNGDKDRVIPIHPELRESHASLCEGRSHDERVFSL